MTREQFKYFRERLLALKRAKHDTTFREENMPKEVKAASLVMKGWAKHQRKVVRLRQERLSAAYSKAYQVVLFSDNEAGLKALKEFERFKP